MCAQWEGMAGRPITGSRSRCFWLTLCNTAAPLPRAKAECFFTEQSYRSRWKQKVGVGQMEEQSYRFAHGDAEVN